MTLHTFALSDCVCFIRYFFVQAKFERCKSSYRFFRIRWLRGVAEPGAFYYPRSSLRFILRVCRPDSGILWILRGGDTGDTLSVVAFELTVYSIESDLHSCCSAVLFDDLHDEN